MTVDEFLTWAVEQPGRHELVGGSVYAMSPEGAGHAKVKFAVQTALVAGIRVRGLPCHMLPDGMTVRIDEMTAYEPDALVYCGPELPPSAIEVPNPVIVVEVLSPSTRRVNAASKLAGYFRLSSVAHYLLADPTRPMIFHHARQSDDTFLTRIVTEGQIELPLRESHCAWRTSMARSDQAPKDGHKARLLAFTASASTYTSAPMSRNFFDICAIPTSLSFSVAA
jgi:Uma2 family endonuclease